MVMKSVFQPHYFPFLLPLVFICGWFFSYTPQWRSHAHTVYPLHVQISTFSFLQNAFNLKQNLKTRHKENMVEIVIPSHVLCMIRSLYAPVWIPPLCRAAIGNVSLLSHCSTFPVITSASAKRCLIGRCTPISCHRPRAIATCNHFYLHLPDLTHLFSSLQFTGFLPIPFFFAFPVHLLPLIIVSNCCPTTKLSVCSLFAVY